MPFARVDIGDGTPAPTPLLGLDGADWFKIIEVGDPVRHRAADRPVRRASADHRMFAPISPRGGMPGAIGHAGRGPVAGARPLRRADGSTDGADAPAQIPPPAPRSHRSTSAASKVRCANPRSRRSAKSSTRIPKKRSRSSAPGSINRCKNHVTRAKTAVKEDIRSLTGAERAAILMLSLGEEHSAKIWQMMDEDEIKEISPDHVQSGHGQLDAGREAAGRLRLADVGHRLADGFLRIHRAPAGAHHAARTKSARSWKKSAVRPAAPCGTSSPT